MIIDLKKQWITNMARREGDTEIGAGLLAFDPMYSTSDDISETQEEARLALGRFVNLIRRREQMTIEQLAESADIEIGELMSIEADSTQLPEPRTLYQLAQVFSVSHTKLMRLSGLTQTKEEGFVGEAVRYAARSESLEDLNDDERKALDGLIAVLSEKKA